ncbi:MAG: GIY-YIG nuclease family protein [Bacteriovoracaceae bacterium]
MSSKWIVYIIEAENGYYYTGITTDLEHRFKAHLSGNGAKFFRTTKPKKIVYSEECSSKSIASKREYEIKKMSRSKKIDLINNCAQRSFK